MFSIYYSDCLCFYLYSGALPPYARSAFNVHSFGIVRTLLFSQNFFLSLSSLYSIVVLSQMSFCVLRLWKSENRKLSQETRSRKKVFSKRLQSVANFGLRCARSRSSFTV